MSEEAAFLATLKANPADDTARLVYADWLDERDQPHKAAYLRAVADLARLPGGSAEYSEAAARLYAACYDTDPRWRDAAGARFDVILDGCQPLFKIHTIKIVRERTGLGLAEAKAMVESMPTPLYSWLPFEVALPHLLAFRTYNYQGQAVPIRASLRPTAWPAGAPGAAFDVELHSADFGHWSAHATAGIAKLLDISPEEARERLDRLPLTVGSGLQPAAVADFLRQLKLMCNVGRALPPDAVRVVPRVPTQ
jgi:uncharacterized protein (TIGR02996 family)